MGRIFSIMSGKGGVGKSTVASALAEYYARRGMTTVLLDGDTGLRCADLMLGAQNQVLYDLGDAAEKRCPLEKALVKVNGIPKLELLAAPQMMKPSDLKADAVGRLITVLSEDRDVVILDAPAGVGRGLKNLLGAAAEPVIVATPDDVSVRDAEKLGALLDKRQEPRPVIVFNRVDRALVRRGEMTPPQELAQMLDMPLMGILPESRAVYRALIRHQRVLECGDEKIVNAVAVLARRLLGEEAALPEYVRSPILRFFSRGR
ncbi:MAG: P-loop NTPase [Clostridiales bacterium]|nr:P-loop NTPase [Clostridiales bacterium]